MKLWDSSHEVANFHSPPPYYFTTLTLAVLFYPLLISKSYPEERERELELTLRNCYAQLFWEEKCVWSIFLQFSSYKCITKSLHNFKFLWGAIMLPKKYENASKVISLYLLDFDLCLSSDFWRITYGTLQQSYKFGYLYFMMIVQYVLTMVHYVMMIFNYVMMINLLRQMIVLVI